MFSKKIIVIFLVLLLIFCFALPILANERVAVLGFSGSVGEQYRTMAVDRLTKILFNFGMYDLVERTEIDRILAEQNFQSTDYVDPNTAVSIGKILGISQAFIGSIDQLTAKFNENSYTYTAEAKITIKVIDVQTAKILNIIVSSWSSTDKDRQTAFYEALEGCFTDRIVAGIRAKIAPYSKIYKVEGNTIYFENGKDLGVKIGIRYRILRPESNGFDQENAFKRQIGLAEVSEVIADKSQAKIIWKSETVKNGDLLQEVINPGHGFFGVQAHSIGSNLDGNTLVLEGLFGADLPYKGSGKLTFGFTPTTDVGVFNFGGKIGWEMPIIPGILYFTPSAGGGIAVAIQDYYNSVTQYSATAGGLYIDGGCGLKLYLNHEDGMRIEVGVIGQLGPYFGTWYDSELTDYEVTWDMPHQDVYFGGIGLICTLSL